jgi:hypothetical protein
MSKFEKISSNRFGITQFRSIKQLVEYQKQETEREKIYKEQPLCVEQYINPYIQSNSCSQDQSFLDNAVVTNKKDDIDDVCVCKPVVDITEEINTDDEYKLSSGVFDAFCEYDNIYVDKEAELKPVEVKQEIENVRSELKRKQSLKDVVKVSYKHFLKKEPSFF